MVDYLGLVGLWRVAFHNPVAPLSVAPALPGGFLPGGFGAQHTRVGTLAQAAGPLCTGPFDAIIAHPHGRNLQCASGVPALRQPHVTAIISRAAPARAPRPALAVVYQLGYALLVPPARSPVVSPRAFVDRGVQLLAFW